jgi:hypothetical protein
MSQSLSNGCTDPRLSEWSDMAWAHEVTCSTAMTNELADNWIEIVLHELDEDYKINADCEFLFLGFVGMDDEDYTAILFTATDTVVLCQSLSDETNLDHDGTDAIGIMTHSGFWAYFNSFPNCYKHMVSTSCSRHEYWVNKSKTH